MSPANLLAYLAQIALVVVVCAGGPRLIGLRAPSVQYGFWRIVLLACLALPFVEPRPARVVPPHALTTAVLQPHVGAVVSDPVRAARAATTPIDWLRLATLAWLSGVAARLAWIAVGIARLRAFRRRAAAHRVNGYDDLQDAIGTRTPLLWSGDVRHPVTFGLLRPVVLLPVALKAVDHGAQRAVIAHELHHVKRRDWGWLLAEEFLRAVFWFHPAMWWLLSRIQLARETVVDELSILVTNARRTYLDTLLAFADDSGVGASPAFSARRHLFHRVMLLSKEGEMSSLRVAVGSCLLVLALGVGAYGAVYTFPLYEEPSAQKQLPPRDPVPASAYHHEAVLLWEQSRKPSLTREEQLELVSQGITAENKALAINPDYVDALTYKNILLRMQANLTTDRAETARLLQEAEALRDRAIEIRRMQGAYVPGRGEPPPPPPPAPPAPAMVSDDRSNNTIGRLDETVGNLSRGERVRPEGFMSASLFPVAGAPRDPVRIGGEIKAPMKIRDVKPAYPPEAQASRVQGVVIAEILIDTAGDVQDARVLRSIPLLDEAAVEAVRQWRFAPTFVDGVARSVVMTVTVNFSLQ
jgi:TonB family protein